MLTQFRANSGDCTDVGNPKTETATRGRTLSRWNAIHTQTSGPSPSRLHLTHKRTLLRHSVEQGTAPTLAARQLEQRYGGERYSIEKGSTIGRRGCPPANLNYLFKCKVSVSDTPHILLLALPIYLFPDREPTKVISATLPMKRDSGAGEKVLDERVVI